MRVKIAIEKIYELLEREPAITRDQGTVPSFVELEAQPADAPVEECGVCFGKCKGHSWDGPLHSVEKVEKVEELEVKTGYWTTAKGETILTEKINEIIRYLRFINKQGKL